MITIACALWDANPTSKQFSRHYTEADVCALYRGFAKHLTIPFRFICWSEKERDYAEPNIEQRRLVDETPRYGSLTQCYELNEPTIMVGLDTVITGNIDHIARYCLDPANKPAVPLDPFYPERVCNGVSLVPAGNDWLWREYPGQNDMDWIIDNWKAGRIIAFDKLFPGEIVSYKRHVERQGLDGVRICYFHGEKKMHELGHVGWISRHWDYRPEEARRVRDPSEERNWAVHTGFPGA